MAIRKKIIPNLYCGTTEDCAAVDGDWTVIHAAKNPCYHDKCGQLRPDEPHYLSYREGHHLYLNIIDPIVPLFRLDTFKHFLSFMAEEWHRNKPVLIHCNHGDSRAPALCLLFLAKVLYRIRATSFDDAWDDFEKLAGEPFTPGKGIETWLREHWHEIPLVDAREPARVAANDGPVPDLATLSPDEAYEMIRTQSIIHFAACTEIEKKNHKWEEPTPNALQLAIDEAYNFCLETGIECRLLVIKPRQVGCSTKSGHTCYHHLRRFPSNMLVMGDIDSRTTKVWEMFGEIPKHDAFDWDSNVLVSNTERMLYGYPDGSEGKVERGTALDIKSGIAGTRHILWLTEAARYKKLNGHDVKLMTAVLGSLVRGPNTLAIAESTADGAEGWMYETWQKACTLDERKRGMQGEQWNGWIKVFMPWFGFPEHSLPRKPEHHHYFGEELNDRERRGIALYGWTEEQIAWRRMTIATVCGGDVKLMDQDYPEDPDSCFLASGRPRFDMDSLTKMEVIARRLHSLAETLSLDRAPNGNISPLKKGSGEDWIWCIERPIPGCQYLGFLDPCTGAQSEGSPYPDAHACGIIRAGYFKGNVWQNPRLVCAIAVPQGCRWDDELLAERAKRMLDWYGNPMIVPETGNGLGAINELRRVGCTIYQREKMDAMRPGKKLEVPGWETTKDTRPLVVNEIANYIRELRLDCEFLPAVEEMKHFVVNDRGKAEAKSGKHDDWVMGIGIGLVCLQYATGMAPPDSGFGGPWGGSPTTPQEFAGGLPAAAVT